MDKAELIEILKDLVVGDIEINHSKADDALLDFINDDEIRKAWNNIDKWYA